MLYSEILSLVMIIKKLESENGLCTQTPFWSQPQVFAKGQFQGFYSLVGLKYHNTHIPMLMISWFLTWKTDTA